MPSSTTALAPAARRRPRTARAEHLLEGLEEIFLREGFRRVPVSALAARLHCSRRSLYELAPSKNELFLLVLDRLLRRVRRMGLDARAQTTDIRERMLVLMAPGLSELRHASNMFYADVASFPPAQRLLRTHQTTRRDDIAGIVEEGIRQGAFRGVNHVLVADVILMTVQRVMEGEFPSGATLAVQDAMEALEDLLLHGLLHPDTPRPD